MTLQALEEQVDEEDMSEEYTEPEEDSEVEDEPDEDVPVEETDEPESDDDAEDEEVEEAEDGDTEVPEYRPTGRALLEMLSSDPEAQRLVTTSLEDMMRERARAAEAAQEVAEFNDLIAKGDFETVGRKIVERTQLEQARTQVSDMVLREQFAPVYQTLLAQPELQNLSAADREALRPERYANDAHYVVAIQDFITTKRAEAAFEAEVNRRIAARTKGEANKTTAAKVQNRSFAGISPAATGPVEDRRTSSQLISAGFRRLIDPDSVDEDDEP